MLSLSDNNQGNVIYAFTCTQKYLTDLLNIDNPYFEQMVHVSQIYSNELGNFPFLDVDIPRSPS